MCDLCAPRVSRRSVLLGTGAVVLARPALAWAAAAEPVADGLDITPRDGWGADLAPTGPVPDEPDVRFLLVHHSVDPNDYAEAEVVTLLRNIYGFHTSPQRGWPDIAYNFFVDRFGRVWEGRSGSLAGAKAADATGGSQGFAQLVCLLGDHRVDPPTEAAQASLVATLAWLADRHGLDVAPGATTTFTSRGSNRWPEGASVTTPTISGHRDMSSTACPGEAAYALVADGTLARLATERRTGAPAPPTTTTTTAAPPPPPEPATTTTTTTAPPPAVPTTAAPETQPPTTAVAVPPTVDLAPRTDRPWAPNAAAATAVAAAGAALLAVRRRMPPT